MTTPEATASENFNPAYILPGTRIGTYTIHKAIGRGGAQMAYLAEGQGKGEVVFKVSLFPKGKDGSRARRMHDRFLRQVAFFLQLDGVPGVARTFAYDMFPDRSPAGHIYMVQELLPDARNIVQWARAEPHTLGLILRGWIVLADACWRMEQKSICHRDLKPENVLMTTQGVPKIIDFNTGLGLGSPRLTFDSAGHVPGTPAYFSPELCEAILEERSTRKRIPFEFQPTGDLHALGAIFYEVLTGEHPFDQNIKGEELFQEIAFEAPPRPRELNPEVPFGLEKVTLKLLQKKQWERYQSGREVVGDLEALLSTSEDWERPFQTPRTSRHSPVAPRAVGDRSSTSSFAPSTTPAPAIEVAPVPPSALVRIDVQAVAAVPNAPQAQAVPLLAVDAEEVPSTPGDAASAPAASTNRHTWRRRAALAATFSILALASIVSVAVLRQHDASGSSPEKGPVVLSGKAKAAVVAAVCAGISCAQLAGKVRPQDEEWFSNCSEDARLTARRLGLDDQGLANLDPGPNVILHPGYACVEVHAGPVEIAPSIPGTGEHSVRLLGEIRTGSDGAAVRFDRIRLDDGPELPICAIAVAGSRDEYGSGIAKLPENRPRPPASELHEKEGFALVLTNIVNIHIAR